MMPLPSMTQLHKHDVRLQDANLVLRPMTENDWDILLKWNNDPDVLYYAEGDDVTARSLEDIQTIYRHVCANSLCFIIEWNGQPIGECWLQRMNLDRIKQKYPDKDCRRIDLMIGEKNLWGRGIGTRAIRLLVKLAFAQEGADMVFGCDIADYNLRSQRAFQNVGFVLDATHERSEGSKATFEYDYILRRADFKSNQF